MPYEHNGIFYGAIFIRKTSLFAIFQKMDCDSLENYWPKYTHKTLSSPKNCSTISTESLSAIMLRLGWRLLGDDQ